MSADLEVPGIRISSAETRDTNKRLQALAEEPDRPQAEQNTSIKSDDTEIDGLKASVQEVKDLLEREGNDSKERTLNNARFLQDLQMTNMQSDALDLEPEARRSQQVVSTPDFKASQQELATLRGHHANAVVELKNLNLELSALQDDFIKTKWALEGSRQIVRSLKSELANCTDDRNSLIERSAAALTQLQELESQLAFSVIGRNSLIVQNTTLLTQLKSQLEFVNRGSQNPYLLLSCYRNDRRSILLRRLRRLFPRLFKAKLIDARAQYVIQSGLFDEDWYNTQYPDVALSGMTAIDHFVRHGSVEKRNPGPNFDSRLYLELNPDVAAAQFEPLFHYLVYGRFESRFEINSAFVHK